MGAWSDAKKIIKQTEDEAAGRAAQSTQTPGQRSGDPSEFRVTVPAQQADTRVGGTAGEDSP